jgi:hypothetical protein
MTKRSAVFAFFALLLSTSAFLSCRNDDSTIGAVGPPAPPAPVVDQRIVGTWYRLGSDEGIEFKNDGSFQTLWVIANRLQFQLYNEEPNGQFATPRDSVCILVYPDYYLAKPDTCIYALQNSNLTLMLSFPAAGASDQRVYVRKNLGEVIN